MSAARLAINWVEQGYVPDGVIRKGIRRLCKARLEEIGSADCATASNAASQREYILARAETFGYDQGETWWVGHYLFQQGERP